MKILNTVLTCFYCWYWLQERQVIIDNKGVGKGRGGWGFNPPIGLATLVLL